MSLGKAPICCKKSASFIDHGPRIQYWYCKVCKKEVASSDNSKNDYKRENDLFKSEGQSHWADAIRQANIFKQGRKS